MKKLITAILLILILSNSLQAQNYQCVSANTVHYFTNSNHYLRGIRIDSTKSINGNTVLYPYKTARGKNQSGNYKLKPKGSWLGETITIQPDGTHLFDNYWGDTVMIKIQAQLNDTWTFFNDTSSTYYEATLTSVDTMTVLGTIDSIKTITLTAKDVNGIKAQDPLHNQQIIISKNNGFVSVFDLYIFPKLGNNPSTGYDYFKDIAGNFVFKITPFVNPNKFDVFDISIGDEYQYRSYFYISKNSAYEYFHEIVISKQNISPSEINYIKKRTIEYREVPSSQYPYGRTIVEQDTITQKVTSGLLLNLSKLPEEWGMGTLIRYNPKDTQLCRTDKLYGVRSNHIIYLGDSASANTINPCFTKHFIYKTGLGEIFYDECRQPVPWATNPTFHMTYALKNGIPCGPYKNVGIDKTNKEKHTVNIYPNPANSHINIDRGSSHLPCQISISNMLGQTVYQRTIIGTTTKVETSNIPSGLYTISIKEKNGQTYNYKLSIQH